MSNGIAWLVACAGLIVTVHAVATFGSWAWLPAATLVAYLLFGRVILYRVLRVQRPEQAGQYWWCCAWWPRYALRAWRSRR